MRGKVKFFNETKGFGFITPEAGNDVFVHTSNLKNDGSLTLQEGQEVEFEIGPGPKGPQAVNVRRIGASVQFARANRAVQPNENGQPAQTGTYFFNPYRFVRVKERDNKATHHQFAGDFDPLSLWCR